MLAVSSPARPCSFPSHRRSIAASAPSYCTHAASHPPQPEYVRNCNQIDCPSYDHCLYAIGLDREQYLDFFRPSLIFTVGNSSPMIGSDSRKKGLLGFNNTLVATLFVAYSALTVYSYSYPASPKALESYDKTLIKGIYSSNVFLCLTGGLGFLPFASHFKDGESIGHVGFDIFIGLLYLWLLFLIAACCTTLHVLMQITLWDVCLIGVGFFIITVLPSIVYIEHQRLTIVGKWGKYIWGKLRDCGCAIFRARPARFKQALQFCANLSCPWFTSEMEDYNAIILSEMERGNLKLKSPAP